MIIKQRQSKATGEIYYVADKKKYRRIVGGMAWPSSLSPGFALILGEDFYEGNKFKVRDLHIITEIESKTPTELLWEISILQGMYSKIDWYGDTENPAMVFLSKINKELLVKREPKISINRPPEHELNGSFMMYAQLIKKRIGQEKTLYFDDCKKTANGILGIVDIEKFKESDCQPFAALMYAVAAMDMRSVSRQYTPNRSSRHIISGGIRR